MQRGQWQREVAELRLLLLVHAASLAGYKLQRIADDLGLSQSGISRMLSKVSRLATMDTPRQTLIPAADAAVTWLAEHYGFASAALAERCWQPEAFVDYEMLAMMVTPEELEHWSEPMIDVFLVVPESLANAEVLEFEGVLSRLLRRNLIMHCSYLGHRWKPEWLYCADPPGAEPPAAGPFAA